jgi:hypothetical protein
MRQVEDLFKSLEDELGVAPRADDDVKAATPPPLRAPKLPPLTPQELKRLTGKDQALRARLAAVLAQLQAALEGDVGGRDELQVRFFRGLGARGGW